MEAEALFDTLAHIIENLESYTAGERLSDKKTKAFIDTLA